MMGSSMMGGSMMGMPGSMMGGSMMGGMGMMAPPMCPPGFNPSTTNPMASGFLMAGGWTGGGHAPGIGNFGYASGPGTVSNLAIFGLGAFMGAANSTIGLNATMQQSLMFAEASITNGQGDPGLKIQNDFFPNCKTAMAQEPHLLNQCENGSIMDPISQFTAMKAKNTAQNKSIGYDQAMMPFQQKTSDFGITCIGYEKEKLIGTMTRDEEKLKAMQTKVSTQNAQFKQKLQTILRKIADANTELDGAKGGGEGSSGDTRTGKGLDFSKLFNGNECQMALDPGKIINGTGLYSIRDMMKPSQALSQAFTREQSSGNLNKMLESDIKQLVDLVNSDVEPRMDLNFPNILVIYNNEKKKMQFDYTQIRKQIVEQMPEATNKLPENLTDFGRLGSAKSLPSADYYKDLMIKNCLNDSAETYSMKDLMNNVQQLNDKNQVINAENSESLRSFKGEMARILQKTDSPIQEQMKEIDQLVARYGLKFQVLAPKNEATGTTNVYMNITDVLKQNVKHCDDWYQYRPIESGSTMSRANLVNENINKLRTFQQSYSSVSDRLAAEARKKIIDCEGMKEPLLATDCSQALDRQGTNFCVKNAVTCSNNVNSCVEKANKEIATRENTVKVNGNIYNFEVASIVDIRNKLLQDTLKTISENANKLAKQFPGVNFSLQKFLTPITKPEKSAQPYGVDLFGGGNFDFLNTMVDKFGEILAAMTKQKEDLNKNVDAKIEGLKTRYAAEKKYWDELVTKCNTANATYSKMMTDCQNYANRMMQQSQMQAQNYCTMSSMAPVGPGCAGQAMGLTNSLGQASAALGMNMEFARLGQYSQICNRLQTSMMSGGGSMMGMDPIVQQLSSPTGQGTSLATMCRMAGNTQGIVTSLSGTIRDNAWQFAATLNTRFETYTKGTLQPEDPIKFISQNSSDVILDAKGNVVSIRGIPKAELMNSSAGLYLSNLIEINNSLGANKTGKPDVCTEHANSKRSKDYF
jgi:hypothetical protein